MNQLELAWAAGFFDGEGCARLNMRRGKPGMRDYGSPVLSVAQKDIEPLERFHAAVGCGRVAGPYVRPGTPMFYWRCGALADVERVIDLLWPYLSEPKRLQIKGMVAMFEEQALTRPSSRGLRKDMTETRERLLHRVNARGR